MDKCTGIYLHCIYINYMLSFFSYYSKYRGNENSLPQINKNSSPPSRQFLLPLPSVIILLSLKNTFLSKNWWCLWKFRNMQSLFHSDAWDYLALRKSSRHIDLGQSNRYLKCMVLLMKGYLNLSKLNVYFLHDHWIPLLLKEKRFRIH